MVRVIFMVMCCVLAGVGEGLQNPLRAALALAPDDAARSRLEGVIVHTQAAVDSLRMIIAETRLR